MGGIEPNATGSIALTGLRGAIARGMQQSWQAPHVTMSIEADAERFESVRRQAATDTGQRVSVTACLIKLIAITLKDHPHLNARMAEKHIEICPDINIGVAVDTQAGLMVPVLKKVQDKSLSHLVTEVSDLAQGARSGTLTPGTYQGGTFTVSSLGATEIESFTPLLNPPQVAVLGVTRIKPKPVVVDDQILIKPMTGLHLSFDHRAVDGAPAGRFLTDLKARIESGTGL